MLEGLLNLPGEIELRLLGAGSGLQVRVAMSQEKIDEYAELYALGRKLPPIDVYRLEDGSLVVVDGFHRVAAAHKAGLKALPAKVHEGTHRQAKLFAIGANARHGLPRTDKDKRNAVAMLLDDPEWGQWSNVAVAEAAGVSEFLVRTMRRERTAEIEAAQREAQRRAMSSSKLSSIESRIGQGESSNGASSIQSKIGSGTDAGIVMVTRGDKTFPMRTGNIGQQRREKAAQAQAPKASGRVVYVPADVEDEGPGGGDEVVQISLEMTGRQWAELLRLVRDDRSLKLTTQRQFETQVERALAQGREMRSEGAAQERALQPA